MADPTKLDLSDYFAAAVTGLLAGIGGAMTWFSGQKKLLNQNMETVNKRLDAHSIELAKVQVGQQNLESGLVRVENEIRRSAEAGAQTVSQQFAHILSEIRKTQ